MFTTTCCQKAVSSIAFLLLAITSLPTQADIVFTAPPRENPDTAKELYEPIAAKLSSILGENVIFEAPDGWADYAKNMRDGRYDIVFDGPHFAAWRLKNLNHVPVAALPGTLDFYIIARNDDDFIKTTRSLVGQKICAMPSPHLSTDLIYDLFPNPVLLPVIYEVKGGILQGYKAFKEGKCRATIIRAEQFHRLPEIDQKSLKIVTKTRSLPNQTVTVSQRLQNNASQIAGFFTSQDGSLTAEKLLSRFSKNNKQFQSTNVNKYAGAEDILEGVVWGW
ncbi:phosphate/phosphite/phosphonate ABC transporter substrate-binding protein [Kaarinaea lacus]